MLSWSVPYTNPCGVVSQAARSQLADATALLRANPSVRGWANVAVLMAGVNDTNWVTVARQLVGRQLGGPIAARFGATPNHSRRQRSPLRLRQRHPSQIPGSGIA